MMCNYVCPTNHFLESWNDANPEGDYVSFAQPAIRNIYDTRQWQESTLRWTGNNTSYYDYLKEYAENKGSARDIFDVLPFNIVVADDGRYQEFDREWRLNDEVDPEYILFRGLFWFVFSNSTHFDRSGGG